MQEQKNKIVCIVGESGSGKTALYDMLRRSGYKVVDSYTTRPPRTEGEKGHTFVTQEEFDALRADFAAYTEFDGYEYATTFKQLKGSHFYVIDPAGVEDLAEKIGRKNFVVVYLQTLQQTRYERMKKERGEKHAAERIIHDKRKFRGFYGYDEIIQNETLVQLYNNAKFLIKLYRYSNS